MMNGKNILIFICAFVLLLGLDMLWFTTFSLKYIYTPQFKAINGNQPFQFRIGMGFLTWIVLSLAMTILVTTLIHAKRNLIDFFLYGLLTGFVIYFVYNGTNYSTLKNYKLSTVIVDTTWGTILQGFVAFLLGYFFRNVQ